MVTETLLNSLKSLFSSLGAKTSDSNYAVGLFDKTTAEPKGLMGMSDLASVLGAFIDRGLINNTMDADDIVTPGIYSFRNNSLPSNMDVGAGNGILRVSVSSDGGSNTYILQEVISRTSDRVYASRFYAGTWGAWAKVLLT